MAKLKKDGTPKNSGGKRAGSGRKQVEDPSEQVSFYTRESRVRKIGVKNIREACRKLCDEIFQNEGHGS